MNEATIGEIQRAPGLLLAIKKSVDEGYRPGRFLLTGSANVMTMPQVAESLAVRIETLRMLPLARAEVEDTEPTFLDRVFAGKLQGSGQATVGDNLVRTALAGGFPESLARNSKRRRQSWARSWLASVLTRDLRDIAEIEKLTELPKFIRLLAGTPENWSTTRGLVPESVSATRRARDMSACWSRSSSLQSCSLGTPVR